MPSGGDESDAFPGKSVRTVTHKFALRLCCKVKKLVHWFMGAKCRVWNWVKGMCSARCTRFVGSANVAEN